MPQLFSHVIRMKFSVRVLYALVMFDGFILLPLHLLLPHSLSFTFSVFHKNHEYYW